MTKEDDNLLQQAWELLAPDAGRSPLIEDRLRDARILLLIRKRDLARMQRDIEIGEAVLAKLGKS